MFLVKWRLCTFFLTLAVWGILTAHCLDDGSENRPRKEKRLLLQNKIDSASGGNVNDLNGDISNQILGNDWQLVEEREREGECQGTREKVETFKQVTTGLQRTVVTKINSHRGTVYTSDEFPGLQQRISIRPELNCLQHDDPILLKEIRRNYLIGPSKNEGYNSTRTPIPEDFKESLAELGQDAFLDQFVFKGKVNRGFFVEAGADDFVSYSNSLMFERAYRWNGLLVEPNPIIFAKGLQVQRKAWSVPTCLATNKKPHLANFAWEATPGSMAGLVPANSTTSNGSTELQCFPLASLLLALNNPTVNYLSLDLEGSEFEVIKTIPFKQLKIEVLSVEFNLLGRVFPGNRSLLHAFLGDAGYSYIGTLGEKDDLFVQALLLGGKYRFDREAVSEEEWPEFSFWEGDRPVDEGTQDGGKHRDEVNTKIPSVPTEREKMANNEVDVKDVKEPVRTTPHNCWPKAVASGKTFMLLKNAFWNCWLNGGV